jgi:HPt (histidine-containing phosphotransfer) domain-containing protein
MGGDCGVSQSPPNDSISALESVLGPKATREVVQLFLHDFPESVRRIAGASREDQMRIVHGIKSSSLHMGATGLSERMAALEDRLATPGTTLEPEELAAAVAEFRTIEPSLREYAGT